MDNLRKLECVAFRYIQWPDLIIELERAGWKVADIANALAVPPTTIYSWKNENKPTPPQVQWHMRLSQQGHRVAVCWGWEAARDVIEEYLTGSSDRTFAAATGGK